MAFVFPAGSSATLANTGTTASITLSVTSIGGVSRSIAMADISALTLVQTLTPYASTPDT